MPHKTKFMEYYYFFLQHHRLILIYICSGNNEIDDKREWLWKCMSHLRPRGWQMSCHSSISSKVVRAQSWTVQRTAFIILKGTPAIIRHGPMIGYGCRIFRTDFIECHRSKVSWHMKKGLKQRQHFFFPIKVSAYFCNIQHCSVFIISEPTSSRHLIQFFFLLAKRWNIIYRGIKLRSQSWWTECY